MKSNEEETESLEGLGDLLPAEVLKEYKGSIVINIYKPGSQHVDHVENQYIGTLPEQTHPNPPCLGREEKTLKEKSFDDNTPLSVLFRENHHEELRKVIESWRPYLINDELDKDALVLTHFKFDKKSIHSKEIYVGLLNLANIGALQVSLSQLARYLSDHSNLSNSYTALYQQIKHYRQEWQ